MTSSLVRPSAWRLALDAFLTGSMRSRTKAITHSARLASRLPPRFKRCRCWRPEEASSGATPHSAAKDCSFRSRSGLSPAAIKSAEATSGPIPRRASGPGAQARTSVSICVSSEAISSASRDQRFASSATSGTPRRTAPDRAPGCPSPASLSPCREGIPAPGTANFPPAPARTRRSTDSNSGRCVGIPVLRSPSGQNAAPSATRTTPGREDAGFDSEAKVTQCYGASRTCTPRGLIAVLVSKTRAQGASVVTTLPAEVARRLSVTPGQELEWIEDGMGGFRVMPHTPETAEALAVHERIMTEYDAVFRALAK